MQPIVITFNVVREDNVHQSDFQIEGTLKEINDRAIALSNEGVYLEPSYLKWKGVGIDLTINDLSSTVRLLSEFPDMSIL